jgi:PAS domain S-box-containing protein
MSSAESVTASVASPVQALPNIDKSVLDVLPSAVYVTDACGRILYYNRAAASLWGREPALFESFWCGSWKLYRPDGTVLPHDQCPMAITLKQGRPVRGVEAVLERPDGTRIPFIPYPAPLFDAAGTLVGAVNMMVDISGQKTSETTLRNEIDERLRVEEAHERLVSIIESSDDAIVSKDLDGIIVSWNGGAERLFGYTAKEVVGKPVTILIPAHRRDEESDILERIRRGERVDHYETIRQRKDGSLLNISLTVSPVRDSEGKVVGASKIARDVTPRKRAEDALAQRIIEQAALYRFTDRLHKAEGREDVYEAALDGICQALGCERASILLFDAAGVMRFVAWRGLSEGYRRAVDGHSPWTADVEDPAPIFFDDLVSSDIPEDLKETIRSEGIAALGFIPLVANGRLIGKFMTYYGAPHTFTQGEIDLAATVARQLGFSIARTGAEEARQEADESLRKNEQRLQLALEAGHMGAWEWDLASGGVVWSPGLQQIHGLGPGSFGGSLEDFKRDIHPDDLSMVLAEVDRAIAARDDYHVSYRIVRPDGQVRWLEAFGRFVLNPNGSPQKLGGVCMDVTTRKQAEAERDLLVAELSHRVKNTLATVLSIERQSFSKASSIEDARRSFGARIQALAQTHGRLADKNWSGVSLQTLFLDELAPYRREDSQNVRLAGSSVVLNPKCALTLGLAIHELATNAAKYGALSAKGGLVEVSWQIDPRDRHLQIRWIESGGPAVERPARSGFGRLLLERALASDLKGSVDLDFAAEGLRCHIAIPLEGHVGGVA